MNSQRQRDRVHEPGHSEVGRSERNSVALHRPREAAAERLHRVIQRQPARRAAERGDIWHPRRRPPEAGALALRLQHRQAALIAREQNTVRSAPDAWAIWGLRARRACPAPNRRLSKPNPKTLVMN